ncbi:MAG: RNA-binding S4 domain-containing protein [Clostridia bacterium]|nr:RNA-binding S4 domain-containing protein [Clostridia bacterium]
MRIDKYLKVCRLIRRRTMANEACDGERILINGKVVKPSKEVKVGDLVSVVYGNKTVTVRVLSTENTVKKEDAAKMYEVVGEE